MGSGATWFVAVVERAKRRWLWDGVSLWKFVGPVVVAVGAIWVCAQKVATHGAEEHEDIVVREVEGELLVFASLLGAFLLLLSLLLLLLVVSGHLPPSSGGLAWASAS